MPCTHVGPVGCVAQGVRAQRFSAGTHGAVATTATLVKLPLVGPSASGAKQHRNKPPCVQSMSVAAVQSRVWAAEEQLRTCHGMTHAAREFRRWARQRNL